MTTLNTIESSKSHRIFRPNIVKYARENASNDPPELAENDNDASFLYIFKKLVDCFETTE